MRRSIFVCVAMLLAGCASAPATAPAVGTPAPAFEPGFRSCDPVSFPGIRDYKLSNCYQRTPQEWVAAGLMRGRQEGVLLLITGADARAIEMPALQAGVTLEKVEGDSASFTTEWGARGELDLATGKIIRFERPDYKGARATPYENRDMGIRYAYPAFLQPPAVTVIGIGQPFYTGHFSVGRTPRNGATVAGLMALEKPAGTERIVATEREVRSLDGHEALFSRAYFDSAAGRRDWVTYQVPLGDYIYGLTCETRQGPPVVPWEEAAPACDRLLQDFHFITGQ